MDISVMTIFVLAIAIVCAIAIRAGRRDDTLFAGADTSIRRRAVQASHRVGAAPQMAVNPHGDEVDPKRHYDYHVAAREKLASSRQRPGPPAGDRRDIDV